MQDVVKGPAIGLMVTGGIGGLLSLWGMVASFLGMAAVPGMGEMYGGMDDGMFTAINVVSNLVGLAVCGLIFYGGMQMRELRSYGLAMTSSILAVIPCFGCCLIGIPIGIWAIVVLMKPEVKEAFQ